MGRPIDQRLVMAYSGSFKKVSILRERGFSVLVNVSGHLFKKSIPTLKDVEGNTEAGMWVIPKYHNIFCINVVLNIILFCVHISSHKNLKFWVTTLVYIIYIYISTLSFKVYGGNHLWLSLL